MWFVYTLRCCDGSFYTGITTDLRRRLIQHNAGRGGHYTRAKRPVRYVFREAHASRSSALKREAQIKRWPHLKKKRLWSKFSILAIFVGIGSSSGVGWVEGPQMTKKAAFAAGCFWGVEKILSKIPGVVGTSVGYAGGIAKNPTYEQVCTGRTQHAEVVEVVYDPARVSYDELLIAFWEYHDPTTINRQGPDVGSQYRSVIFVYDDEQKKAAHRSKQTLEKAKVFQDPIVTEIVPAKEFYQAEEYHQKYLQKNPAGHCSHHLQSAKIREVLKETMDR